MLGRLRSAKAIADPEALAKPARKGRHTAKKIVAMIEKNLTKSRSFDIIVVFQ
jgi:hypothetical protein